MHSSIPLEFPIELIDLVPLNPLISKCVIKVCYVGDDPNRNGSIITKEVAREMANSLPGSPIVGYYNEDTKDFEEHNRILSIEDGEIKLKDATRPYGFVDLSAKAWFQKFLDDGVNEREYLVTEGYLWTGQYPECERVLEEEGNNHSMELDEETLKGSWAKDGNKERKFFIINEAIFSKLCILGEDYEPCFEGSSIKAPTVQFSFDDGFKQQLFSMLNELKQLLQEGGDEMEVNTIQEVVEEVVFSAVEETEQINENSQDENSEVNTEFSEEISEPQVEICEKCGKPVDECTCETKTYSLEEIPEYVELKAQYDALVLEHSQLVENSSQYSAAIEGYEALKAEAEELRLFKANIERKEKKSMIDSFYMLSDEDKADVLTNIDSYSLDEIEAKLSVICVRNKVSFSLEEEPTIAPSTTFNLEQSEDESVPAWVKRAISVAKSMNQ